MSQYRSEYQGYYIQPHKDHPYCYVIVTTGKGGKIPDYLSGMFTTRAIAKSEIDVYVASRPIKEPTNGKADTTGGSK